MAAKLKTLGNVNVATAGTAVPLTSTPTQVYSLVVRARKGNTGKLYIGDSTVTSSNGVELDPGELFSFDGINKPAGLDSFQLEDIYINAANNGDGARVMYVGYR